MVWLDKLLSYPILFSLLSALPLTVHYPFLVCAIAKCRSLVPCTCDLVLVFVHPGRAGASRRKGLRMSGYSFRV